jgi:2-polyprenyl-3-methyl-5-hydroxy-6-metoxy-1,4-benzoquinol methylase
MFLSKRSHDLELIDLGPKYYSQEEYLHCLEQLDKVGTYLGGDKATFRALKSLPFSPETILDVGCGGGGFTKKLGENYPNTSITGVEISREAVEYAINQNTSSNVHFKWCNIQEIPSKSYDVVICTLVCHHLSDEDLISFLKECQRIAKRKVLVNDLHRHPIALLAFSAIAPIAFKNRLISKDGSLSIKRAFKRQDWNRYLKELHTSADLSWHWPFRWILQLDSL